MKKSIIILALLALLITPVFAETLLEMSKKGYDPYLADKDGFDSLFVNPASISGDTEAFSLAVEGGTWGELSDYKFLLDNVDAIASMATDGTAPDAAIAAAVLPDMVAQLDQDTFNALVAGTTTPGLYGMDPALAATLDWTEVSGDLTAGDLAIIAGNVQTNDDVTPGGVPLQTAVMDQFTAYQYSVGAEVRVGTLIKGFGFGAYSNAYFLYSLGAQGLEDVVVEVGAVAGYGFDVKRFSFGVSGKFALLTADNPAYPFSIASGSLADQQIIYGYAWGLDAGVNWEPLDGLRFGVVFSDIIGSITPVDDMGYGTIGDFFDGNVQGPDGGYAWNFDVSAGMSWQPDWKGFRPKFSVDFYDIVGLTREMSDDGYSGVQDFYEKEANTFLRHMRVGANIRLLGFLDIGASYYMEYITLGAGLDFNFLEFFVEAKAQHDFSQVGANAMLKIKF